MARSKRDLPMPLGPRTNAISFARSAKLKQLTMGSSPPNWMARLLNCKMLPVVLPGSKSCVPDSMT